MLHARPLSDQLQVAPQIQIGDIADIARLGFRSILNNRPDGEAEDQPSSAALASAAAAHGLAYAHQPVRVSTLGATDVLRFQNLLAELPKPILGFCRTGTRTTMLWTRAHGGPDAQPQDPPPASP